MIKISLCLLGAISCMPFVNALQADNAFLDRWMLTLPDGRAGWLEVTKENGYYNGSLLWGGGSVLPVDKVEFSDSETLVITRSRTISRKNAKGEVVQTQKLVDTIRAKLNGDTLRLTIDEANNNGKGSTRKQFTGKRQPPMPPRPDLKKVKFGKPIVLFDGTDLNQWRLLEENDVNGWVIQNGVLTNYPIQRPGLPRIHYGNLRTNDVFEDFNLKMDFKVAEKGNSGIYLRGIYEIQVFDSYGKPLDSHNMGAIYSRVAPSISAEKPANEWQTIDITLVDRHVTVILNGVIIHDNVPLAGCTGGALWSDVTRPGPIYLQGDHSQASFRDIVLTPVVD